MDKQIGRWSYLLGVASVVIAIAWRALGMMGMVPGRMTGMANLSYDSFIKGALLLLLTSIATASYASTQGHKA